MPLDLPIDVSSPVMISGATGYVAGHMVKRLLEAGVTIHAPVRDPTRQDKLKYLNEIAVTAPGAIRYFSADLLKEGSYAEAMEGCSIVFHTASPFSLDVNDPQKELVDPALLGTRNVLGEANRHDTVKRVVLTSSCAAIFGDNADVAKAAGGVLTEADWNTTSTLEYGPYSYSKTVAEQEAGKIVKAQSRWDLVVINPSMVFGPGISPFATSESFSMVKQFGDGTMKRGTPRFGIGVVDVRDVAYAHLAAAYLPQAQGRHIISGHNTDFFEIAQTLVSTYGDDYPIPQNSLPKWLVWLVAPIFNKSLTRKMVTRNVDVPWIADNRKSIRELGVEYRPLGETMNEMFQQLVESGQITK
ncbi:NAD-dependent epimerase/dehydratase family protein [Blastopirellula sp. J2-11]|uniref:NAD-dependent epimerase/dehydratase family protein n=1 Tax=Blastopirellula sp. J2-11 TaxID=2943192 RepID=UPI0021C94E75|nr:NAD-dependent epimerase/dehydratase family protein [Blastopirellula sp. J2-11]UUO05352.1 NAD-dependent epimerase/dehydratase family protein [Blastopirellula sp. J2-11]